MYTLSDYVAMIKQGSTAIILFNKVVDLIQKDLLYKTIPFEYLVNYMERLNLYMPVHDMRENNTIQFAFFRWLRLYIEYKPINNEFIKIIDVRF